MTTSASEMFATIVATDLYRLNATTHAFIDSLQEQFDRKGELSEKQTAKLEQIYAREAGRRKPYQPRARA